MLLKALHVKLLIRRALQSLLPPGFRIASRTLGTSSATKSRIRSPATSRTSKNRQIYQKSRQESGPTAWTSVLYHLTTNLLSPSNKSTRFSGVWQFHSVEPRCGARRGCGIFWALAKVVNMSYLVIIVKLLLMASSICLNPWSRHSIGPYIICCFEV